MHHEVASVNNAQQIVTQLTSSLKSLYESDITEELALKAVCSLAIRSSVAALMWSSLHGTEHIKRPVKHPTNIKFIMAATVRQGRVKHARASTSVPNYFGLYPQLASSVAAQSSAAKTLSCNVVQWTYSDVCVLPVALV
jgi:hypothetical protein